MAATQSSTQSDSQTQKSKIWQDKLGEARADTTEVTTEPFLIHHTKVTVITRDISNKTHGKERKKEEKKETTTEIRNAHPSLSQNIINHSKVVQCILLNKLISLDLLYLKAVGQVVIAK